MAVGEVGDLQENAKLEQHRLNASYLCKQIDNIALLVWFRLKVLSMDWKSFSPSFQQGLKRLSYGNQTLSMMSDT